MRLPRLVPALVLSLVLVGCSGTATVPEETTQAPVVEPTEAPTPEVTGAEPATTPAEPTPSDEATETTAPAETTVPAESENPEPPISPEPLPGDPSETGGEWTAVEIEIGAAADAAALSGLPEGYQSYVAELVETVYDGGCQSDVVVTAHHPAGFVTGQEFAPGCGGSNVVWAAIGGVWGPVISMQALVPCTEFSNNAIPKGHPELECLDDAGAQTDW